MKILILPGGGVFGAIPARLLASLGKDLHLEERVNCFGGSSIGAILSLFYATGRSVGEAQEVFTRVAKNAFSRGFWSRMSPFGPKYDTEALESVLKEILPDNFATVSPIVVATAMDFKRKRYKVFDNIVPNPDLELQCWQIARASSAAQTYFAPYDCETEAYLDGGQIENLPVVTTACALHSKMDVKFHDMDVFVVGTGKRKAPKVDVRALRGLAPWGWLKPTIEMVTAGNEMASSFWANQMGFHSVEIFNPVELKDDWKMDNPAIIPALMEAADEHRTAFYSKFSAFTGLT